MPAVRMYRPIHSPSRVGSVALSLTVLFVQGHGSVQFSSTFFSIFETLVVGSRSSKYHFHRAGAVFLHRK